MPKRTKVVHRKSGLIKEYIPLFPGYIFVSTDCIYEDFYIFYKRYIENIDGCVKILKYKDNVDALWPQERQFIEQFTDERDIIDISNGFASGNRIVIINGPLLGKESIIRKINRHKRTATIELALFGETQLIELSCEIISKINEE